MRKKVEKLVRRDQENSKIALEPAIVGKGYSNRFQDNIYELDKMNQQEDDWKAIKKHPMTKVLMVVGITMGLVYMSSHMFNLAANAATSFKKFKKALEN